jgi:methyltransferase family protein
MDAYQFPKYYEIAFSWRDAKMSISSKPPSRASRRSKCDPRWSLVRDCRRTPLNGTRGYQYCGLDLSRQMIAAARACARRERIPLRVFRRDMNSFRLPGVRVELAYLLLGSIYATSNRQLFSHFDGVARVLKRGGLYVADGVVQSRLVSDNRQRWTQRREDISVTTTYSAEVVDHLAQTHYEHLVMDVRENGKKRRIESRVLHKQEFLSLVECHGAFEFVHWCSDFNLERPPASDAQNQIILRRKHCLRRNLTRRLQGWRIGALCTQPPTFRGDVVNRDRTRGPGISQPSLER